MLYKWPKGWFGLLSIVHWVMWVIPTSYPNKTAEKASAKNPFEMSAIKTVLCTTYIWHAFLNTSTKKMCKKFFRKKPWQSRKETIYLWFVLFLERKKKEKNWTYTCKIVFTRKVCQSPKKLKNQKLMLNKVFRYASRVIKHN